MRIRELGLGAATIAITVLAVGGCVEGTTTGGVPPTADRTSLVTTAGSASRTGTSVESLQVPEGYVLAAADATDLRLHARLAQRMPAGTVTSVVTWRLGYDGRGTAATLTRLTLTDGAALPVDPAELDRLFHALGATPLGDGSYSARVAGSTRVGRLQGGWLDTFVWADASGRSVWVLTEHFDPHSIEWSNFPELVVG